MIEEIKKIISAYSLGELKESRQIDGGLINQTFFVRSTNGDFVVQKMNPMYPSAVTDDYSVVENHLNGCEFHVPKLIPTIDGKNSFELDGRLWRVFEYVDCDPIDYSHLDPSMAAEAGAMFGRLHRLLAELKHDPVFTLQDFHKTRKIVEKLESIYKSNPEKAEKVKEEFDFICNEAENLYLPEGMPEVLIHGDPKIFNILFKDKKAVSVVDFDGVIVANPLLEVGDALRDWCQKGMIHFDHEVYKSALKAYLKENPLPYDESLFAQATKLIAIELSARFLTDYFEESYFAWDDKKYKTSAEHNLQRTRDCLAYYKEMKAVLS